MICIEKKGEFIVASIGVSVYGLSLQNKGENDNLILNALREGNFMDLFRNFANEYGGDYVNNEDLEKVFKVENYNIQVYERDNIELFRYAIGKVKTGAYGYSSEIVNTNTGAVNYNKTEDDAEVMPFYFCFCMPIVPSTKGILILQTTGVFGIKSIFNNCLEEYLNRTNNEYRLSIGSITPVPYITRFLQYGILQKIRFIRYNIPADRARQLGLNNGVEEAFEEYTIHKPLGFVDRKRMEITQCLTGQRAINNVIEIADFDYDNIKLDFKMGRKNKTINLSNIDKIIVNEDITDNLDLINGQPTEESITPVLLETALDYLNDMGLI
jgi:hypothetical protein